MDGPLLHLVLRTSKNVQGGTTMSAQDIIKSIEDAQLREVAEFKTGDTVRVHAKVKEGNRERIQEQSSKDRMVEHAKHLL